MEDVILNDVANGSGLIVEGSAALNAKVLRHGDLYALNVATIPERLQK